MARSRAKRHWSLRLPAATLDRLRHWADETGDSQAAPAARYIEEGLRTDEHPGIAFRSGAAGRRPALAGTRIDAWQVIETIRGAGGSVEEAATYLGLPEWKVRTCVGYHAEEIDARTRCAHEDADRERASWTRELEVIGRGSCSPSTTPRDRAGASRPRARRVRGRRAC
ncbi:MAG: hypothetical protein IT201_03110 [Thermoleophilia bacterium]|nr:hypothetical protein [Thermoleophilia bacterium]